MFADHETSERRMSWRTERRINIFFMVRNTANIYREKGIVACNSERWSRLHLFPPSVFYSARSSESARSVRVFRSVSQQNSKDTTSRLRIAIITRASISDLGCKRHYTRGPIMHAIDSGHFVIFIPRSPTDARSLLSPDGRLCSVMIYSIFFFYPSTSFSFFTFLFPQCLVPSVDLFPWFTYRRNVSSRVCRSREPSPSSQMHFHVPSRPRYDDHHG